MYFVSDEDPMPYRARKPKVWCGGKLGRKHIPEIVKRQAWPCRTSVYKLTSGGEKSWFSCWHEERCSKCGKVLRWKLKNEECPEWYDFAAERAWWSRLRGIDLDKLSDDL
jgi:hypothetical protein